MANAESEGLRFVFLIKIFTEIIFDKPETQIAVFGISIPVFALDTGLVGQLPLGENITKFICLIIVFSITIGIKIKLPRTERQFIIDARNDTLCGPGIVFTSEAGGLHGKLISVEHGVCRC